MIIQTTRTYEFTSKSGETFVTAPLYVGDAPDWIRKDPLFAWGVKDGSIKTVDASKGPDTELEELRARALELEIPDAEKLSKTKLKAAIAEKEKPPEA